MLSIMWKILALGMVASLLGCSASRAQQQTSDDVVARIGDKTITLREVEEQWRKDDPSDHADAIFKVYEGRRKALDEIIARQLFTEAAKGSGLSTDAWEEAEISKRAKDVTDDDVRSFYAANQREMEGRSFESAAPLITRFLTEQKRQDARRALVAELRKNGTRVRVSLEAPRYMVPVSPNDPSYGNQKAPVTIVEFSDFQCPYCLRAMPTLKRLQQTYGDRLRVVWKDFPLTRIHPQAAKAAEAAHCAEEQGKFWPYHDRLFANQSALMVDDLKKYAQDSGLDAARFTMCLDSSKYASRVREGLDAGTALGVSSTPTLFVNGRVMPGAYPYEELAAVIDEELQRK
jgi:protein-disulfide isomerase